MTQQEISTQLFNDYNAFISQKFEGKMPEWCLEKFPMAIMKMPQQVVPYHAQRIQQILTKTTETLSIFEAGLVTKVILAVKPEGFGWELEEFLLKRTEVELIHNQINALTSIEEARLKRKEIALTNMGGQRNNRIIKPIN